jgi:hypothetical protein
VTPTPDPSALPVGDLPHWHQVLAEDFTQDAPLGTWRTTSSGSTALVATNPYSARWGAYPSSWKDTSGNGTYDPAATLSAAGGVLDVWVRTLANGEHAVAAPMPKLPTMTYGRYSIRFRSDAVAGYKTAWLLWPDDNLWPAHGEIDFPEGDLDSTISAFSHYASAAGGQDAFPTSARYTSWHTATVEWTPGSVAFSLDGVRIGTSTRSVPTTAMHWVVQTETRLSGGAPSATAAGHVQIDWAAAWTYVP